MKGSEKANSYLRRLVAGAIEKWIWKSREYIGYNKSTTENVQKMYPKIGRKL